MWRFRFVIYHKPAPSFANSDSAHLLNPPPSCHAPQPVARGTAEKETGKDLGTRRTRGPETRGPGDQKTRTRGPEHQGTRGPRDQGAWANLIKDPRPEPTLGKKITGPFKEQVSKKHIQVWYCRTQKVVLGILGSLSRYPNSTAPL